MARFCALVALLSIFVVATHGRELKRLADYLRTHSDPDVIPPSNGPIIVVSQFTMMNVAHVDEERNLVELEGMSMMIWDAGLSWSPADYGGINSIVLPSKYFWLPPLHTISTVFPHDDYSPNTVKVFSNGTVVKFGLARPQMLCDVSEIATTGSNCSVHMSFWSYHKGQMILVPLPPPPPEVAMRSYFADSKYMIIEGSMTSEDHEYAGRQHQILISSLVIKEKPHAHHGSEGRFRVVFTYGDAH